MPDSPQAVAMAASQLRYFDVTGVLLMGTNLWHEARLVELAARDVQGAILPGCFDPGSSEPIVRRLRDGIPKGPGSALPSLLEAQGYDAAQVLRHLIRSNQAPRTRQAMRDALLAVKDLPGVCGPITISPQRLFDQPVVIFTVDRAGFRPVQPQDRIPPEPALAPAEPEPAPLTPNRQGRSRIKVLLGPKPPRTWRP